MLEVYTVGLFLLLVLSTLCLAGFIFNFFMEKSAWDHDGNQMRARWVIKCLLLFPASAIWPLTLLALIVYGCVQIYKTAFPSGIQNTNLYN